MNDVRRFREYDNGSANRNVDFVGGADGLIGLRIGIDNFPPPLMAGDLNRNGIFLRGALDGFLRGYAEAEYDEKRQDSHGGGGADEPGGFAIPFFIFHNGRRLVFPGITFERARGESENHQHIDDETDEEDQPVEPFNLAALCGNGLQHGVRARIEDWSGLLQHSERRGSGRSTDARREFAAHGRVSGFPVMPVGACLGIDDSAGLMLISSVREGATSFGSRPLSERT